MGGRNKTKKEESAIARRVNKTLVLNVNSSNSDRPVNPTVDSIQSLGRNNSAEERAENDIFPFLRNAKNVKIGALNFLNFLKE